MKQKPLSSWQHKSTRQKCHAIEHSGINGKSFHFHCDNANKCLHNCMLDAKSFDLYDDAVLARLIFHNRPTIDNYLVSHINVNDCHMINKRIICNNDRTTQTNDKWCHEITYCCINHEIVNCDNFITWTFFGYTHSIFPPLNCNKVVVFVSLKRWNWFLRRFMNISCKYFTTMLDKSSATHLRF